jgi:hypothetical protein
MSETSENTLVDFADRADHSAKLTTYGYKEGTSPEAAEEGQRYTGRPRRFDGSG